MDTALQSQWITKLCPFCSHLRQKSTQPCFSVNETELSYLCHHCGEEGFNIPPKTKLPIGLAWLTNKRKISLPTIHKNHIVWNESMICLEFPYMRNSVVTGVMYRGSGKKIWFDAGFSGAWYGYDDILHQEVIIIVEGQIDKLTLNECGFWNCASLPNGSSSVNFIDKYPEATRNAKKIIFAGDMDAPGLKCRSEVIEKLGRERCWVVNWPEGCNDANDTLVQYGGGKLIESVHNAIPVIPSMLKKSADVLPELLSMIHEKYDENYLSTGWKNLDTILRLKTGNLLVCTGIGSSGKSEFVDALFLNMAINHKWNFIVFSGENLPVKTHYRKYFERYLGKPYESLTEPEILNASAFIDNHFTMIQPGDDGLSTMELLSLASSKLKNCARVDGILIDPWKNLRHDYDKYTSETKYIERVLEMIRRFSINHNVLTTIVAHPTKMEPREDGTYNAPDPYKISGSAAWYNTPDVCICVHRRDRSQDEVQVLVQKIRDKRLGSFGDCYFQWERATGRFYVR